jgi:Tfp pilus assembly protein PilP
VGQNIRKFARSFAVAGLLWATSAGAAGSTTEAIREPSAIYSPVGKRDPFKPPTPISNAARGLASIAPLEQLSIEQLTLRGILREGKAKARAMFEDASGNTYILKEGDRIGRERGTISRILNTEVIVTEKTFNYLGVENLYEKVLSLPQK